MTADPRRTEAVHPAHADLDRLDLRALVDAFVDDQQDAVRAVQAAAPALTGAVGAALPRLRAGGRLVYAGAGTSGRLGVLDATELTPTFSWPPERAVPLIAGGEGAIRHAVEGAEDSVQAGQDDVRAAGVGRDDVLLALAASGTTPYVLGAIHAARAAGALTVGIANNPDTPLLAAVDCPVLLDTGPEVISGSTRLKAGTAQKIALNTLSSALMVQLGKVYGNLMVDMRASNEKLQGRALRLVVHATGADEAAARTALAQADGHVKTAVVMLLLGVDASHAEARLRAAGGQARAALERP
ncbi:N-acetylmuramic acid 6-phosphate etherase [Deinococcus metalli]|uniref:N-acetylmuramic acid 6-phosphate etherase n=1 Tax=Deinococcus metalli TaxID=1141878 RepID=A0A7W8KD40_9DEIO|nr:N-acetylmuramic acid 6-phosphate etherase [Deinococcus metalli]MBB5375911.1 N-acetylmuramic acid 6-phosphate etherase [Deinococcus metalli]GHF36137.1 N-acetylmuramic acid 6-phosphate etherase [Deinococcus metalli]